MKWLTKGSKYLLAIVASIASQAASAAAPPPNLCGSLFQVSDGGSLHSEIDRSIESLRSNGLEPAPVGDPTIWKIDGRARRPQDTYENSFEELFAKLKIRRPKNHFESLLRSFRKSGQTAHVLDLFGSGVFLPGSSSASSVTGLRLEPLDWARAGISPKEMPTEVLGDITNLETWQSLDRSMQERKILKMDLVTMRPEGGWFRAPWYGKESLNFEVLSLIVRNVALRLNTTGRFYFDVPWPEGRPKPATRSALKRLQREIESQTPFTLVLVEKIEAGEDLIGISGALIPKQSVGRESGS